MAEAYPVALRTRVVRAYEAGEGSYAVMATQFQIGTATVKRWVRQQRREGHVRPRRKAGGTASVVTASGLDALIAVLGDPTAGELTAAYNRTRRGRARVHVSSMKRALHRHDYVVKKNAAGRWRWRAPQSKRNAGSSCAASAPSRSGGSCSSTNPASTQP
jgi:transposase